MGIANKQKQTGERVLSRKSWVSYILPLLIMLASGSAYFFFEYDPPKLANIPLVFFFYGVYKIIHNRSYRLYIDDIGVWVFKGVLPWKKGVNGVKWRDLDEAVYHTGFFSWFTRSYRLRISHRFTKDSEIILKHMAKGNKAVTSINSILEESISNER